MHAQLGGELVRNFGGRTDEVEVAQRGLLAGVFAEIKIRGVDTSGHVLAAAVFRFTGSHVEQINVDSDENTTMIARLDRGLAAAVQIEADRYRRLGLVPRVSFIFPPDIEADPQRVAALHAEYGLELADVPPWADGYDGADVLAIEPANSGFRGVFLRPFRR